MFSLLFWQLAFVELQLWLCSPWKFLKRQLHKLLMGYCWHLAPLYCHALLLIDHPISSSARFVFVTSRPGIRRILRHCMCCTVAGHSRWNSLFFFLGASRALPNIFLWVLFVASAMCDVFIWQAALALCTTLVSPKFSKKINYCSTLAELHEKLGVQLDLPNFVV